MNYEMFDNKLVYCENDKIFAEITFPQIEGNIVDINHTFVDDSLRGKGIAGTMMHMVAVDLQNSNRLAKLTCSYAVKWFEMHPDFQALVVD